MIYCIWGNRIVVCLSRGDPLFTEQKIGVAEGEWKVA
jgi:hypothetical protein